MKCRGFPCPCCGYLTRSREESGTYEICPVCDWEDDEVQFEDPTFRGGANDVSLEEAIANFKEFGVSCKEGRERVRAPLPDEIPLRLVKSEDHELHSCRVCGLYYPDFFPWGEAGTDPTFDICSCCGSEFGYEDATPAGARKKRSEWIAGGKQWFDPKRRPENWSPDEQLKNIPEKYR